VTDRADVGEYDLDLLLARHRRSDFVELFTSSVAYQGGLVAPG